ncbi:MAG TPA: response regulator [Planctomycetaceae bacterium]|jgi:CheY-like chemotaxis protein|nr:response regulator [Planctomycetaceae bacterium]
MNSPHIGVGNPEAFRAPYRILVVDDNKDAAESMRMLLQLLGGDVRTAGDGLEALDLAEHFLPHAIVLDIGLPKLDGFQAARRIRAKDWGKNVALVAVSGWCRDEDRQNSADAGFDGHLAKPVPVEQIRNLIQGLLDRAATGTA